ncbi:MAG TPA: organic hydroperoxide resistance protein [Thermomicrobiales bacterium]|nr:organic hydroperoxide resistance protein [Thermomicrobiales bacterium]
MGHIDPKYTTSVTATGGREGQAVSDDGVLNLQLRRPKLNGKSEGTNPEQLFAAAWAGCFQSALIGAARETGDDVSDSLVTVEVSQGPDSDGGYGLAARIAVEIPGVDSERARQLADSAHQGCPYSRATRGNIEVEVRVVSPSMAG